MPKFKVLRPIEHNHVLYLPESKDSPGKGLSGGDGKHIPVDASGQIELSSVQAQACRLGQLATIKTSAPAEEPAAKGKKQV